ncbi:MAG TPA: serine/threonine-protein kinase [Polyangiaceae bacterium]|jgi:serine/threonine-protein kinase
MTTRDADALSAEGDVTEPNASSVNARVEAPRPVPNLRVMAGKTVGRYRLLLPIGAGGMAQVWAALPQGGGIARPVAVKLVLPEYSSDPEYERLFLDEAMVASAIRHPNVCEIRELGRDGDRLFMVLELVLGDSLSGLIQRGHQFHPLPYDIAARIVADACAGLHAAHDAPGPDGQPLGIVHRDISPPNVLVSLQGHVKVSDFGIAKARYQLHARTRTGEIKGKFAYIPPEQILGRGVDRRADVYALGCVLYVATLGMRPFGGGTAALGKIVHGEYCRPHELDPSYPSGLEAIVSRALSVDPSKRFETADEMRLALERWLISESRVLIDSDVANVVKERLRPERRAVIEATLSSGRTLPNELVCKLLSPGQDSEAPTADSRNFVSVVPGAAPPPATGAQAAPTWRPEPHRSLESHQARVPKAPSTGFERESDATARDRVPSSILPPRRP